MNAELTTILTSYGGLGVLALFAWLLLKSVLKQQERLTGMINNHLSKLLERQEAETKLVERLLHQMERHDSAAQARHEALLKEISK